MPETWILHTDGGSRGNPGPSGIGFTLTQGSIEVASGGAFIGTATNNVAEYEALIWGLENALALGAHRVEMIADSELMVKQVTGAYKIKNDALKALAYRVQTLLAELESWSFEHTLRHNNEDADALVNQALDAQEEVGDPASPWTPTPRTLFDDTTEDDPMTENPSPEATRASQSPVTPGTYYLTVKDHFDAAHRLYDYPGPCRELHGHTWDIEVTVSARELDSIDIVYDFKTLKDDLHAVLDSYDHHYLNEIAPFDEISPTAENLARVIYDRLHERIDPKIKIEEVVVWESPIARLAFRADDAR